MGFQLWSDWLACVVSSEAAWPKRRILVIYTLTGAGYGGMSACTTNALVKEGTLDPVTTALVVIIKTLLCRGTGDILATGRVRKHKQHP